jgi:uncharacterized phage protein gp47/JayE
LDTILEDLTAAFKTAFGDNFNTDPQSPMGQWLASLAESYALLWEVGEATHTQFIPSKAVGAFLSDLVALNGIQRREGTHSTVTLTLTGSEATFIPAGSQVATSDTNDIFETLVDATIPVGLTIDVDAQAVVVGPISAATSTITEIVSPLTGWSESTNASAAVEGDAEESDAELRSRREVSTARPALSVLDGILHEVLNTTDVTDAKIYNNDTGSADGDGVPAHAFETVVRGGDGQDIADSIFLKKPVGIEAHGDDVEAVEDTQGTSHVIKYTEATEVDIYIIVNTVTTVGYPTDGDDQIKQAILDYAAGLLVEEVSIKIGESVNHSDLFTPVNTILGHNVTSLKLGTSPAPAGEADLAIAFNAVANFELANIVVNS